MTTTIKDIAKRAGVSHSTVSRALQDSPLISVETSERIQKIAHEMGYHVSAVARSLKTNTTKVLGVVVSSIDDPFFSEILQGIEDVAQTNGYSLFIAASQHDPEKEQNIVKAMVEHRADGVIVCSTSFGIEQSRELIANDRPIVVVNNHAAEEYRYSIYHDDVDGSQQVTRHLIGLGHEKIAYIGNSESGRVTSDRLSGFNYVMQQARLAVPREYVIDVPSGMPENGLEGVEKLLALPDRPTAIFCFNDMIALGVLQGLQRAGLQVPEDVSVAGFDNIFFTEYTQPPLTTLDQPKRFIGMEASRLILDLLSSPPESAIPLESQIQRLKGKLLIRQSTGKPRCS